MTMNSFGYAADIAFHHPKEKMGEIGGTEGHSSASANKKWRNKQKKCSSDLTSHLPDKPSPLSPAEYRKYQLLEQQFQNAFRQLNSIVEKSRGTNKEAAAELDDPVTFELEGLLSSFLSTTLDIAVRKLVLCGYNVETAEWAILSSSNFNGSKDAESNIVEGALALLEMNEHVEMHKNTVFEGFQSLVEYTLLEMIHVVRELRPELTVTEVMWCLLMSDLDLATACRLRCAPEASGRSPGESSGTGQSSSVKLAKGVSVSLQELKMDDKPGPSGSRKAPAIHFKRDLLCQKANHFEKNYGGRFTKGSFKAKVAAWGSMVLDQSLELQSGGVMMENYSRLSISEGGEKISDDPQLTDKGQLSALPAGNLDTCMRGEKVNFPDPPKEPTDHYAQIPFDDILQEYVEDQLLLVTVPLKAELKKELEGWYDWANEKVMQVACKLWKELPELKTLRQERKDIENCNKQKQTVEESRVKHVAEMDHRLANEINQIQMSSFTVKQLETETDVLRRGMEAARMEARGSEVKLDEAAAKEQEIMKKLQAWEVEKDLMIEKLTITRREIAELESQIGKRKNRQNQFKVLLRQEEKERLKDERMIDSLRRKREKVESVMKAEADNINRKVQMKKQNFEDNIKNLQRMVSELKLESEKKKIAALNASYGLNVPNVGKRLTVFQEIYETGVAKEERECVMCMNDEISVVLVPCGHQVLCGPCNDLHEKQGMKDCPSCRGMIDSRVSVCFR
ncbi:Putative E3 ubiquitin-protein ligase RF298 [Striga hermonthica]|uniref:E3 ubiquitin-protein ligase RF298 n=1 Tax=Striga hermonthica TaxID=68872 RepID=A0A9N7NDK8_STRHE|nr:Putative E3 ubiquitin-protein ligase RF298 [Striga hermonthica]